MLYARVALGPDRRCLRDLEGAQFCWRPFCNNNVLGPTTEAKRRVAWRRFGRRSVHVSNLFAHLFAY